MEKAGIPIQRVEPGGKESVPLASAYLESQPPFHNVFSCVWHLYIQTLLFM